MKKIATWSVSVAFGVWLLAGCGKPSADSPDAAAAGKPVATNPSAGKPNEPKPGEKNCFACKGAGTVKCQASGCDEGWVDCPGPCLKLTRGTWVHMDVAGHPPTDVWQKFYESDGGWMAYNQGHVGHVIVMQNGKAVDSGPCSVCGGRTKVQCPACKGTGRVVCPICNGRKIVPLDWSPTNNPWLNRQPDLIRLNDGRMLFGKITYKYDTLVHVQTRDGRWLSFAATNFSSLPEGITTNLNH